MKQVQDPLYSSYIANCVFNVLSSYTAIMLNILTIHALRKTPSLPKTLKALLLSLAVSDLGVGLLVQPFYIALMVKMLQQNAEDKPSHFTLNAYGVIRAVVWKATRCEPPKSIWSMAYAHVPDGKRRKLNGNKSKKMRFVGNNLTTNAGRLFDKTNRKLYIRRDVEFHENDFGQKQVMTIGPEQKCEEARQNAVTSREDELLRRRRNKEIRYR
ncbi:hypothetical protein ACROYT_G039153 [Oculina patagonica]